ncbi:ABC transporter permease [Niastella sp. OAS944]|uniref:ABC transporter permease n=1 Tax=Niastella sp. OAS944 TaxID=2664089 RepID=UPI00348C6012|nr:ABC-2 type transport system permease protein [Chitinophagaceae bacterium OAS944]
MNNVKLIARHFLKTVWKSKVVLPIYMVWLALVLYAVATGYATYTKQNELRKKYQAKARQSWEANPDKHPHRMAHFGSFAFRIKHPLSMFDNGMESYTGNAVFLEAHKQNTANYSEASFSTGLLRFGEISEAMLLQTILPLILFFLGFNAVAQQRENATLKILVSQGAAFKQIIWGNSLGLFAVGIIFLLPVLATTVTMITLKGNAGAASFIRFTIIGLSAIVFLWIISVVAIGVSAISRTSRSALLSLLGVWLMLAIVLPKTLQAIGNYLYPAPGKIQFQAAVEEDILKQGDSHNPDDVHFKKLKDSILRANKVDSIQQLSFNYSGFIMQEGERMSAQVYDAHLQRLLTIYDKQNRLSYNAAFINPFIGFKNITMAFSGTDFAAYRHFQQQAEAYRYDLAQTMNVLQMKYISNRKLSITDKPYSIDKSHWTSFPDFKYQYQPVNAVIKQQWVALVALAVWLVMSFLLINYIAVKAKVI